MKKTYTKPDIMFDNFSLCSSIAATCGRPTNTPIQGKCALILGGRPLFVNGVDQCYIKIEDGSPQYNGICYHVPTEHNALFNS